MKHQRMADPVQRDGVRVWFTKIHWMNILEALVLRQVHLRAVGYPAFLILLGDLCHLPKEAVVCETGVHQSDVGQDRIDTHNTGREDYFHSCRQGIPLTKRVKLNSSRNCIVEEK